MFLCKKSDPVKLMCIQRHDGGFDTKDQVGIKGSQALQFIERCPELPPGAFMISDLIVLLADSIHSASQYQFEPLVTHRFHDLTDRLDNSVCQ